MPVKGSPNPRHRQRKVQEAVDAAIRERGEVGLQVAAYLNGELVIDVWGGLADPATGRKADGDTIFQAFSMAKPVTSTALHIQVERGLVDYNAPITHYWPEFAVNGKGKGTVRDALTHRLGIPLMPKGVTPELMSDFDWMVRQLAAIKPMFEPGTSSSYMSYTFGWPVAEVVRRTDPKKRPFGAFVQEEICQPLGIDSLWLGGMPDEVEARVALLTNAAPPNQNGPASANQTGQIPPQVGTHHEVFDRPDVRRACIPGANCLTTARSEARFFAMVANGGKLDGARIISEKTIQFCNQLRPDAFQVDPLTRRTMSYLGMGGFHIGPGSPPAWHPVLGFSPNILWHDGAGGSIGWADLDTHLAVAICHNRMFYVDTPEENPFVPIGKAIREALGLAE